MSTTPAHSTIIRGGIQRVIGETLANGRPGRVESYDAVNQRANVQPLVLTGRIDPLTGDRVVERQPVITDVPVLMLGTARSRTTMDLQPGDTVWILASWLSIDSYLVQGGEVDPQDDRRHFLKDAVCLPAVFDFAHVPHDASTDGTVLHTTKLRLGGPDASDPIVRKSDLDTAVQKLNAVIDSYINHSHLSGTPGNPTGPALSPGSTPVTLLTLPHLTTPNCSPVVSSK